MSKEVNPALTPEREAFRKSFQVRLIDEKEEGSSILALPDGVYGYTTAPASDEMPVFRQPVFRCTELMKLDGHVKLVGYLTPSEKAAVEAGQEPVAVDLYPEPYKDATALLAVPLERIDRRRQPTRDDGNAMRIEVAPAL